MKVLDSIGLQHLKEILYSQRGAPNGVATLDANSRMPQNLTAPTETYIALGSVSGTKAISGASANVQSMTIAANTTITLTAGASASECRVLTLIITNGGAFTVTWPASVKWAGGSAPTFSAAGVDVVTLLTVDGGVTWLGSANGVSYA